MNNKSIDKNYLITQLKGMDKDFLIRKYGRIVEKTKAEYDALSEEEKNLDGVLYYINDSSTSEIDTMLTYINAPISWEENTIYEDYPWTGVINWNGITEEYSVDVRFSPEMVNSGIYAPFAISEKDVAYIYASEQGAETCPLIIAMKVK